MENVYYYFVASLPMISFESEPPFSSEDFLNDCKRLLVEDDYALAEDLLTRNTHPVNTHNRTFNQWATFIRDFKNEEVWFRAEAAGKDPSDYLKGERIPNDKFTEVLQQAQKAENLLEAQKILDRFRWNFLDELEAGRTFSFSMILIYGLKLKILERYAMIESPKGEVLFKELKEIDVPLNFAHSS